MSTIKIIGNPSPKVGVSTKYSLSIPLEFPVPEVKSIFNTPVIWAVYLLEHGRWRKVKEQDKIGDQVEYVFTQRSLLQKGIRLVACKGE